MMRMHSGSLACETVRCSTAISKVTAEVTFRTWSKGSVTFHICLSYVCDSRSSFHNDSQTDRHAEPRASFASVSDFDLIDFPTRVPNVLLVISNATDGQAGSTTAYLRLQQNTWSQEMLRKGQEEDIDLSCETSSLLYWIIISASLARCACACASSSRRISCTLGVSLYTFF